MSREEENEALRGRADYHQAELARIRRRLEEEEAPPE
jgi:hypothetical protein